MTLDHIDLQRQHELEQKALTVLGWNPNRVACASLQEIKAALETHRLQELATATYLPETIVPIVGFVSSHFPRPLSTVSSIAPPTLPSVPPPSPIDLKVVPGSEQASSSIEHKTNSHPGLTQLGKTPIVTTHTEATSNDHFEERWCQEQAATLKALLTRRSKCETLLAQMALSKTIEQKGEVEQSLARTNDAIHECLQKIIRAKNELSDCIKIKSVLDHDMTNPQKCLAHLQDLV